MRCWATFRLDRPDLPLPVFTKTALLMTTRLTRHEVWPRKGIHAPYRYFVAQHIPPRSGGKRGGNGPPRTRVGGANETCLGHDR